MIDNIAIITTVSNFSLYEKSVATFPAGIPKYVIDGSQGMYGIASICYMFSKLKNKGIEWLIMIDDDIVFIEPDLVYNCIEKMKDGNYVVSGVADGGVIGHRKNNPHVINSFFSILNFKEVAAIWDENEVLKNQYLRENEFGDDLSHLRSEYDQQSLGEPYYCFYLWLRRKNKKILFLDAVTPFEDDELTSMVMDANDQPMLYHTWFSRAYGKMPAQTQRIDNILKLGKQQLGNDKIVIFKDPFFRLKKRIKRKWNFILRKLQLTNQSKDTKI